MTTNGMFTTGVASRSFGQPDPLLHLLVDSYRWSSGFATFCGDGSAEEANTARQRRCPACLRRAREDLEQNGVEPGEPSDVDWYLGRVVATTPLEA